MMRHLRIPSPPRLRPGLSYLLALLLPAAGALVHHALLPDPALAPFVSSFLAVMLVAWAGGTGPGLAAVLVAALIGNAILIHPEGVLKLQGPALIATLLFLPSAATVATLAGSLRGALHEAERKSALARKYQLLAATSRDIVLLVRADDGRIVEANAAGLGAYGYSTAELRALTIRELRAPEAQGEVDVQLRRANQQGVLFETIHRRKDGSVFPVEVSAQGGLIEGERAVVSVVRDITERKRTEQALREAEQRVRLKLESILSPGDGDALFELHDLVDSPALQALMQTFYELTHIPMSIVDLSGKLLVGVGWQEICTRFHRVHPTTCAHCLESDTQLTTGIRPGEFRRYRCKNLLWDAATPIVVGGRHLGNLMTGQFFYDDEQPDRELFRAQARRFGFPEEEYLAALDAAPRLGRQTVAAGMDFLARLAEMLSQLGHANIRLARALQRGEQLTSSLRETDRRKTEFLAMLSHELRNPLTPVRNSLYILERVEPGGEQAGRALAIIDRQTSHLTRLVDDLLDSTRIAHGKIQLRRSGLDLRDLVRQVAEDHRASIAARGLELQVELPWQPIRVDGDQTRLAQSLGNLLSNASKFTERGSVRVSLLEGTGGQAEIRVTDTGPGIPAEMLPRLFRPFVQADTSLERSRGGLGLGLAVARALIEMHGGALTAHSSGAGQGATFVIRLPRVEQAVATAVKPEHARGTSRRVLIIEDVVDAAQSLGEALLINQHRVEIAYTGQQGLELAQRFRPEVILCDIGLPEMDGYAVARAVRADPLLSGAYLVALTGYASTEDLSAAQEAGFDLHLAKPPQLDLIETVIARAASG